MTSDRRLLLVHAHPDDESSQSSATLARYTDEGAQVTLVTCTLGEQGEILVSDWAHYSPAELGKHRIDELATALGILGVTDHVWLGGPGRYHDTGMGRDADGNACAPDELPDGCFWHADLLEAANHLVEIIRDRRPHVVSTYDPFGNYGHPDHIQAHRVTMYACVLAASASHRPDLGPAWQVPRILWHTNHVAMWEQAIEVAREQGLNLFVGEDGQEQRPPRLGADPQYVAAVIPYGSRMQRCVDALAAHRSQVNLSDDFWRFFGLVRELPDAGEAYVLAGGVPFPDGGIADDLFAGLDVSA